MIGVVRTQDRAGRRAVNSQRPTQRLVLQCPPLVLLFPSGTTSAAISRLLALKQCERGAFLCGRTPCGPGPNAFGCVFNWSTAVDLSL
jgi:hypothetical protein